MRQYIDSAAEETTGAKGSGPTCRAKLLGPAQRQEVAVQVLAGQESASQLARDLGVSRKFVGQQTAKAEAALQQAFGKPETPDDQVLFELPVTRPWLRSLVLGLTLICHSSQRGVVELLRDLFDFPISLGSVHNILADAVAQARPHNAAVDLSRVRVGALDEIFQHGQPVLVGCDVDSTYCYLLSLEEHRDRDTWGTRLLELVDRGFNPQAAVADFGTGLRAGLQEAVPHLKCRGDLFHALYALQKVVEIAENQAYRDIDALADLHLRQQRHLYRHGRKDLSLSRQARDAAIAEAASVQRADDLRLLVEWLHYDIWSIAGPRLAERRELFDFVLAELKQRLIPGSTTMSTTLGCLERHRDELLEFAVELEQELAAVAAQFQVEPDLLRQLLHQQTANPNQPEYWQREARLHQQAHGRLHELRAAVQALATRTVRGSSMVENLNSRLRNYFFLRRHVSANYLELLQFFLNHRRFLRSERPERRQRSPRELLTAQPHAHWLELLGYRRFQCN
jgi:hypothetical protein